MADKQTNKNDATTETKTAEATAPATAAAAPATGATGAPPVAPGAETQAVVDINALQKQSRVVTCVDPFSPEGTVISRSQLILREYAKGHLGRSDLVKWYNNEVANVQGLAHITYQTVRGIVHAVIGWNQADLNRRALAATKKEQEAAAKVERERQKAEQAKAQAEAVKNAQRLQAEAQERAKAAAGTQAATTGSATAATAATAPATEQPAPATKTAPSKS